MKNIIKFTITALIGMFYSCTGTIDPQPTTLKAASVGGTNFTSGTSISPASIIVPAGNTTTSFSGGGSTGTSTSSGSGSGSSGSGTSTGSISFNGTSYSNLKVSSSSSILGYFYVISNSSGTFSLTLSFTNKPTSTNTYNLSTTSFISLSGSQGTTSFLGSSGTVKVTISGQSTSFQFTTVSTTSLSSSGSSGSLSGTIDF